MNNQNLSLTGVSPELNFNSPINTLECRRAMGLNKHMHESQLYNQSELYEKYRLFPKNELVKIAEDPKHSFFERWVSSQLLAILGDPRINTYSPDMLKVEGAFAELGLDDEKTDCIVNEFEKYGVLREWIVKETPLYHVKIESFLLAKYCVTNKEYLDFLLDTNYENLPSSWPFGHFPHTAANHPVHTLSPESVETYIQWLNNKTGRNFRLPTEAEWEYASSGVKGYEYPWGNEFLADRANTIESGIIETTAVGIFPLGNGPFGHSDLAGNIEEYVADNYKPYPGGKWVKDDLLKNTKSYRVARGGSFTRFRDLARTRRRHGNYGSELYVMGFRLAESITK